MADHSAPLNRSNRRIWLEHVGGALLAGAVAPRSIWGAQADQSAADEKVIASVQAAAQKAGIGPFRFSKTEHYLGLGDADDRFRNRALEICESLKTDFLRHFGEKGFKLAMPEGRLTIITLRDDLSYQAFVGRDPGTTVAGHYDLETNQLVMFDLRPKEGQRSVIANPERVNLMALVHETTHQLCFNTGLLSRKVDVPEWVSEGLATYAEVWRKKQTPIGAVNVPWLEHLRKEKAHWISIPELMASDKAFGDSDDKTNDAGTTELAYAESWLLVHYLMKKPRRAKFQAYLSGLATDQTADKRTEYAEKLLGALKDLDHELARELKRLLR
jgi:hypothetical protein